MPRVRRLIVEGVPYHITQRGNHKQDVFDRDADRARFLETLQIQSERQQLRVLAYCLMTNHVHLVLVPELDGGLPLAMRFLFRKHAIEMNFIRKTSGHLWQNRYGSFAMDRPHLYQAIRYVELNPVRAGLVARPEDWQWSSAREHLGFRRGLCELRDPEWHDRFDAMSWREWLESPQDMLFNERLREATKSGRPIGSDEFVAHIVAHGKS